MVSRRRTAAAAARRHRPSGTRRGSATALRLSPLDGVFTELPTAALALGGGWPSVIDATTVARGLGYVVGTAAVILYAPIAVRVVRQGSADGLTLSTWWLKLTSYTCSIVYFFDRGYPFSAYSETVVLAGESVVILGLVAFYQRRLFRPEFAGTLALYGVAVGTAVTGTLAPEVLALGQAAAAAINVFALAPQFALNYRTQSSGDYSPVTLSLAATGCAVRLFTTAQLADGDPLLLGSFGLALVLNASLLAQTLYYGTRFEGKSVLAVMASDYAVSGDGEERTTIEPLVVDDDNGDLLVKQEERVLTTSSTRGSISTAAERAITTPTEILIESN